MYIPEVLPPNPRHKFVKIEEFNQGIGNRGPGWLVTSLKGQPAPAADTHFSTETYETLQVALPLKKIYQIHIPQLIQKMIDMTISNITFML